MSYDAKRKALKKRINAAGIRHFSAREVLTLGSSHYARTSSGFGKNKLPPGELIQNIIPALTALDDARSILGKPVLINSTYRHPAYNKAIGGASRSKHMSFTAIDCHTADPDLLDNLYRLLAASRKRGEWTGGLGGYNTFIHLDCGSNSNRTWGKTY